MDFITLQTCSQEVHQCLEFSKLSASIFGCSLHRTAYLDSQQTKKKEKKKKKKNDHHDSVKSEHKDMIHTFLHSLWLMLSEGIIILDIHHV